MKEHKYKIGDKLLIEVEIVDLFKEFDEELVYDVLINKEFEDVFPAELLDNNNLTQKKSQIPQKVIDWYNKYPIEYNSRYDKMSFPNEVSEWLYSSDNIKEEAIKRRAFSDLILYGLNAVEVESKFHIVKLKTPSKQNLLVQSLETKEFSFLEEGAGEFKYKFTKQELINSGWGMVFDNNIFEITELG